LEELGAQVVSADQLVHELYRQDAATRRELGAAFGEQVLLPEGDVDRAKLGAIVFHDARARARLNAIVHPKAYQIAKGRLQALRRQGAPVVVLEAPLLVEAGWTDLVDEVWVTQASEEAVLQRLGARNHLPPEEVQARVRAQAPPEERARGAHAVIDNSGDLAQLRLVVARLWASRIQEKVR
jgi:dephospho-CoA kinase